MRLKLVRVQHYKRFAEASSLDTRGPIVAIVGPNEAGKTSLLRAIAVSRSNSEFDSSDFTDRQAPDAKDWVVETHFSLEAGDREQLGDLVPENVELTYKQFKYPDGISKYYMAPWMPRDLTLRRRAREELTAALKDGWLPATSDQEGEPGDEDNSLRGQARELLSNLNSDADTLPQSVLNAMYGLSDALLEAIPEELHGEEDIDATALAKTLGTAIAHEREEPPHKLIHDVLKPRRPKFLLFESGEDRMLQNEYVWSEHANPPAALANLFALAQTDYDAFKFAAMSDDRPVLDTLQEVANRNLDEAFKAWRQADLHVAFSANNYSLQLQIRDRASAKRTRLEDRSSGLRSFVALVAFTARYGGEAVRPVLLVDEAEMHLHYGAQADLIRVFERQQAAQTIIYTTHSIGCLPSDLGATIRVVSPVDGQENRSTIYNSFWAARGTAGLTPMMLAMGADALAFTPSRRAVIGEGPSEAILLPSLVRAVLPEEKRDEPLGYQVAPGIADYDPDDVDELEMEAGGVAYLLDQDGGGRNNRRKIPERAKDEGRVVFLGEEEGLTIEDCVAPDVLADALNKLMSNRPENISDRLTAEELPAVGRAGYLTRWCQERGVRLNKPALAQEALDIGRDRGGLVDPARVDQLAELHQRLLEATRKMQSEAR